MTTNIFKHSSKKNGGSKIKKSKDVNESKEKKLNFKKALKSKTKKLKPAIVKPYQGDLKLKTNKIFSSKISGNMLKNVLKLNPAPSNSQT